MNPMDENELFFNINDLFNENDQTARDLFSFSNGVLLEDDPIDIGLDLSTIDLQGDIDFSSFLASNTNDDENIFTEFQNVLQATPSETQSTFNGEQPIEDGSVQSTPPVVTESIPQPITGNEAGVMHQMYPTLSDYILGQMSVKQQPKANYRSRYACDGARFLPESRYNPLSVNLPDLRLLPLQSNQKWGIIITIATTTPDQTIVHANDLLYRTEEAIRIGYGSVFVPLDSAEMENREKKFPRLSILYKKCDEYTFDRIPFNPYTMFGTPEKYIVNGKKKISNAAIGKEFKREYNLLSYKLVFQLAFKEENMIFISHTNCETENIDESKPSPSPSKRSASSLSEPIFEEDNTSDSLCTSPTKKFKPTMTGLPVTKMFNIE